MTASQRTTRFYSLDAARGIAALAVVFWHWQHFFYFDGGQRREAIADSYPFHHVASLLYSHGYMAVDLFFSISGFIFFWLYSEAIHARQIQPTRFMLLRFSRLYPLHFAMLVVVGLLQLFFHDRYGSFFTYPYNGSVQLLQHLTLTNTWTTEGEFSFNGPAWSLSVEIFLYVLFVALCRFVRVHAWVLITIVLVAHVLYERFYFTAVRGIEPFFLGGLMYLAHRTIVLARGGGGLLPGRVAWHASRSAHGWSVSSSPRPPSCRPT